MTTNKAPKGIKKAVSAINAIKNRGHWAMVYYDINAYELWVSEEVDGSTFIAGAKLITAYGRHHSDKVTMKELKNEFNEYLRRAAF